MRLKIINANIFTNLKLYLKLAPKTTYKAKVILFTGGSSLQNISCYNPDYTGHLNKV